MANSEFIVSSEYPGYVFVGCNSGVFTPQGSKEEVPFANMFVLSPVSDYSSEDYEAWGFKAEKKKCIDSTIWEGLQIGDRVKLFFDDRKRVVMAAQDN